MADSVKAKDKVENPKAKYDKPKEIVQDKALSQHEKKKALNTWEQDERQLLTASNEGMPGSDEGLQSDDGNRLGEVVSTTRDRREAEAQTVSLSTPRARPQPTAFPNYDVLKVLEARGARWTSLPSSSVTRTARPRASWALLLRPSCAANSLACAIAESTESNVLYSLIRGMGPHIRDEWVRRRQIGVVGQRVAHDRCLGPCEYQPEQELLLYFGLGLRDPKQGLFGILPELIGL